MRMSDEMSEVFSSDLGATSGDTQVSVINRGGLGAQTIEGIKIVDVAGASNGTFALDGDYVLNGEQAVIAGAYGHRMYQGGVDSPTEGDWYLRSSLLEPGEPGDPDVPTPPLYRSEERRVGKECVSTGKDRESLNT